MTDRRKTAWRWCAGTLFVIVSFVAMLTGCASVAVSPGERVANEVERCIDLGGCFTLSVDNATGVEQATVYLNNYLIGNVEGGAKKDFRVFEHQLIHGRCATVAVRLQPSRDLLLSTDTNHKEECLPAAGGRYTAQITNGQRVVWLTPWAR